MTKNRAIENSIYKSLKTGRSFGTYVFLNSSKTVSVNQLTIKIESNVLFQFQDI